MSLHRRLANKALFGVTVGLNQLAIQALGFASALLVVRLLPTSEYAYYTLANSVLATASLLADSGVATAVMAEGGRVWGNRSKLADVVASGISLRRKFAPIAVAVCTPVMLWMLWRHGARWTSGLMISGTVIVAFIAALSTSLLEVPFKLRQDLSALQRIALRAALIRAALMAAGTSILSWAAVALAANAFAQAWTATRLRLASSAGDAPQGRVSPQIQTSILRVVRLTLPGVIYYCLSGQLMIWLLSIFGTTSAVAQVGALSRLAAILMFVTSIISMIVAPRFARLANSRTLLMRMYLLVLVGLACFAGLVTFVVWRFPDETLAILGPKYRGLHAESTLMALSACLGLIGSSMASLASSRALLLRPSIAIPIGVLATAIAISITDVSTAVGVLTMSSYTSAFSALFASASGIWLIMRHSK